jgi:predicted TIM-barrel fold metal-dependent hydrolase
VLRLVDGKLDRNPEGYAALYSVFGPSRLLYSSNWPLSDRIADYKTYLDTIVNEYPSQEPEHLDRLLRKNSQDVYGWKLR